MPAARTVLARLTLAGVVAALAPAAGCSPPAAADPDGPRAEAAAADQKPDGRRPPPRPGRGGAGVR